jgi:hypothetical protein
VQQPIAWNLELWSSVSKSMLVLMFEHDSWQRFNLNRQTLRPQTTGPNLEQTAAAVDPADAKSVEDDALSSFFVVSESFSVKVSLSPNASESTSRLESEMIVKNFECAFLPVAHSEVGLLDLYSILCRVE